MIARYLRALADRLEPQHEYDFNKLADRLRNSGGMAAAADLEPAERLELMRQIRREKLTASPYLHHQTASADKGVGCD